MPEVHNLSIIYIDRANEWAVSCTCMNYWTTAVTRDLAMDKAYQHFRNILHDEG